MRRIFAGLWIAMTSLAGVAASMCLGSVPAAADIVPPKVDTSTPWGLSAADGQFRIDVVDLSIGSLRLERFTQSSFQYFIDYTNFGMSLTSNFDIYVQTRFIKASGRPYNLPNRYHATVHLGNAAVGTFYVQNWNGTGSIWADSVDAQEGILAWSGTAYQYSDKMGAIYTFNPNVSAYPSVSNVSYGTAPGQTQRIDHINYPDGRVRQFYYDSGQRLKLVTDSTGYAIIFEYAANGFVSKACGVDLARLSVNDSSTCSGQSLVVSYQYGTVTTSYPNTPVLTGFTDLLGRTTSYGHNSGATITCLQPPGYTSCKISVQVGTGETLADGAVWKVDTDATYVVNDPEAGDASSATSSTVTDPAGNQTNFGFYKSSPVIRKDANGNTISYTWCCSQIQEVGAPSTYDGTLLTEADYPEGNKFTAQYNGPFNAVTAQTMVAKSGSGLANISATSTYGATLSSGLTIAKPLSRKDAKGNETDWTYTNFGEIASEMQPAPTSGAARPLKLYSYIQKSAYMLGGSGSPIWMLLSETECQTGSGSSTTTCDTGAPQRITTYQYGADGTADNLLVRGIAVAADGTTRLTCYGYDQFSNKVSETKPRAGLSSCP